MTQAQDSVADQLRRVIRLADEAGEYDAADWISRALELYAFGPQSTGSEQHTHSSLDSLDEEFWDGGPSPEAAKARLHG